MDTVTKDSVVLRRSFSKPAADVFAAFSSPQALEGWLSPSANIEMRVAVFEFAPGGGYTFVYTQPDGREGRVSGAFVRIDAPRLISFTWMWADPDPHAGVESHVAVEFLAQGDGCEIILTHTNLSAPEMAARHSGGWQGAMDRLVDWLGLSSGLNENEV